LSWVEPAVLIQAVAMEVVVIVGVVHIVVRIAGRKVVGRLRIRLGDREGPNGHCHCHLAVNDDIEDS
jgi:hypothetical protein